MSDVKTQEIDSTQQQQQQQQQSYQDSNIYSAETEQLYLNKVVLFPQNKYYCLDMIAAAAVVVAE